jgi:hypothetical protein
MLQGMNQSDAALYAGYAGEKGSVALRSAGSGAARAKPVQALLALAESKGLGVPSAPGDMEELKRILWSHARSKDKSHSIQATKELARIEDEQREDKPTLDPKEAFKVLAELSPAAAIAVAVEAGMHPEDMGDLQKEAEKHQEEIALSWIQRSVANAARAKELVEFCLRSTNPHQHINGATQ